VKRLQAGLLALGLLLGTGCSMFSGNLREDLDDGSATDYQNQPTTGGTWPERSYLGQENDVYGGDNAVGHADRRPAGQDYESGQSSWVTPDHRAQNQRDAMRGPVQYSNAQNIAPPVRREYKSGNRAKAEDFVDETPEDGSLWASNGQTNYYFTRNRTRTVGDIVNIEVEDGIVADVGTELRKTLTERERETELAVAHEKLKAGATGAKAGAPPPAGKQKDASAAEEPEVRDATYADIDVKDGMQFASGETVMAEIIKRFPNGNYMLQSTRRIPYRGTIRTMNMVAVARAEDVDQQDTVKSGKLYEYRIKVFR